MDRDDLKDVLGKTLEVVDLLAPRRHLKYEIIDLVKNIHKMLSERLDERIDMHA